MGFGSGLDNFKSFSFKDYSFCFKMQNWTRNLMREVSKFMKLLLTISTETKKRKLKEKCMRRRCKKKISQSEKYMFSCFKKKIHKIQGSYRLT